MAWVPADGSPATAALLVEHWRVTPVWQKRAAVDELHQTLTLLALSDLRRRYLTTSDAQLQRRLATRWLGATPAERVYGPLAGGTDAAD